MLGYSRFGLTELNELRYSYTTAHVCAAAQLITAQAAYNILNTRGAQMR